jgi:multicomponent Na+:H+ antiporter subunit C
MDATNLTLALLVGVLVGTGTHLLLSRTLLRVVMGFVLIGHGANVVLLLAGGRAGAPPMADETGPAAASDPLPQAMAVTAVVITFGVTALLLALAHRSQVLEDHDQVPLATAGESLGDLEDRPEDDTERETERETEGGGPEPRGGPPR